MRRQIQPAKDRTTVASAIRGHLEGRPEVLCAYLHGSFLDGGPYRDVDVAVWVDPARCDPESSARYAADLSAELSLAAGQPVEVQMLNRAPLAFRYHALKGRPLLVRDWEWARYLKAELC